MQYILDEMEYEEYRQLKIGWQEIAKAELFKELSKVSKSGGATKFCISNFEEPLLLIDDMFVNCSEYPPDRKLLEGEIGTYFGLKIFVFDRNGEKRKFNKERNE